MTYSRTIHQRPKEIETREITGHWESDLMIDPLNRSSIGSVVERKTGLMFLNKMESKSAKHLCNGYVNQF